MDRGMEMGQDGEPSGAAPLRDASRLEDGDDGDALFQAIKDKMRQTAPERIFLNVGPTDSFDEPTDFSEADSQEVTWAKDEIDSFDVEYVRADLARSAPEPAPGEGSPSELDALRTELEEEKTARMSAERALDDWLEVHKEFAAAWKASGPDPFAHPSGPSQDSAEVDKSIDLRATIEVKKADAERRASRAVHGPDKELGFREGQVDAYEQVLALLSQSPKGAAGAGIDVEAALANPAYTFKAMAMEIEAFRDTAQPVHTDLLSVWAGMARRAAGGESGPSAPKTGLRGAPRLEEALGDVYRWHQNQVRLNLGAGLPVMLAEQVELALEATSSAPLSAAKGPDLPPSSQPAPGDVAGAEGRQSPGTGLTMQDPAFEKWWTEVRDPGYLFGISEDERRTAYLAAKAAWAACKAAPGAPQGPLAALGINLEELYNRASNALHEIHLLVSNGDWRTAADVVEAVRVRLAATPSQEEGPAGLDLEVALLDLIPDGKPDDYGFDAPVSVGFIRAIVRALRVQAPASSPRDLEAADRIEALLADEQKAFGSLHEKTDRTYSKGRQQGLRDALTLLAHPPKGETLSEAAPGRNLAEPRTPYYPQGMILEYGPDGKLLRSANPEFYKVARREEWSDPAPGTPIEASAREGLHQIMRDAATITQRLTGDVIVLADRIHDIARASLSSLPQEGAAGEGEPLPSVGEPSAHVTVLLGDGGVAIGVLKSRKPEEPYPWVLTFHPTAKPYPIGTSLEESEERVQDARTVVGVRIKNLEAADVLYRSVAKLVELMKNEAQPSSLSPKGEGPNTSNTNATQEGAQEPKEGDRK